MSVEKIDDSVRKFELENFYRGKTYTVFITRPGEIRIEFNRCLGSLIVNVWNEGGSKDIYPERVFRPDHEDIVSMNAAYNKENG